MLTPEFLERANRTVEVELAPRKRELPLALSGIDSRTNAVGMFHSGARLNELRDAVAQDLRVRAALIWAALVRVHRSLGAPNDGALRQDLKAEFQRHLRVESRALSELLNERVAQSTIKVALDIGDVLAETSQKHDLEIDYYVDSLAVGASAPTASNAHYHFYGAVGAVQTGAGSVANFVQNLSAGEKAAIVEALNLVREAIQRAPAPPPNRDELIAIAEACLADVQSASPNNTMLRGMFDVLALSLPAIASATPAYEALKLALLPIGIQLP